MLILMFKLKLRYDPINNLTQKNFYSASLVAGVIGTTTTSPIDTVKTRMMIQMSDAVYKSSLDCLQKVKLETSFTRSYFFLLWLIRMSKNVVLMFSVINEIVRFGDMKGCLDYTKGMLYI